MDHAANLRAFAKRLIKGSLDQRSILAAADEIDRLRELAKESDDPLIRAHDAYFQTWLREHS